jgi:hypothetical protein
MAPFSVHDEAKDPPGPVGVLPAPEGYVEVLSKHPL